MNVVEELLIQALILYPALVSVALLGRIVPWLSNTNFIDWLIVSSIGCNGV